MLEKLVSIKTPLLQQTFGKNVGPRILLKYEFFQPSGSFKSRGIGHLISEKLSEIDSLGTHKAHVFASSGGNAGLAAAVAAKNLRIPCTVVVSNATSGRMINKIKSHGANLIVKGSHWKEADKFMREELISKVDQQKIVPIYAHPFDNDIIWEGHSYMVDEILSSLKDDHIPINKVKAIVCSFGGGGLYNGIIKGLERSKLEYSIPVVAVETKGADVLNTSLGLGKLIEFENITSCATSLGTANISREAFENFKKYDSKSVVISDCEVLKTCLRFADESNIITEPACGATLHMGYCLKRLENILKTKFVEDDVVILIGCGGSSTSLEELKELSSRYQSINLEEKFDPKI